MPVQLPDPVEDLVAQKFSPTTKKPPKKDAVSKPPKQKAPKKPKQDTMPKPHASVTTATNTASRISEGTVTRSQPQTRFKIRSSRNGK